MAKKKDRLIAISLNDRNVVFVTADGCRVSFPLPPDIVAFLSDFENGIIPEAVLWRTFT
jgi:hypothetical protein